MLSGNTPTTEPAQLLANAQAINDERMEALGREKQTIPAGLDRFSEIVALSRFACCPSR